MMIRRLALLFILALALGGWGGCKTGSATLKAQAVTVDSLVMAGEMFLLVGDGFNRACPVRGLPLAACREFRLFAEGHAPADPVCAIKDDVTKLPSILKQCGFVAAYPQTVKAYQDKKDTAVAVASTAEAIVRQLTGYGKALNGAGGGK